MQWIRNIRAIKTILVAHTSSIKVVDMLSYQTKKSNVMKIKQVMKKRNVYGTRCP